MKDFPGSLIEKKKARNKNSERQISFPFFNDLTEFENYVKTFLHEVCPEACVASILGVTWGLTGLKSTLELTLL